MKRILCTVWNRIFHAPFTSLIRLCKIVGPKPICWAKPACFDFSLSNFHWQGYVLSTGGIALRAFLHWRSQRASSLVLSMWPSWKFLDTVQKVKFRVQWIRLKKVCHSKPDGWKFWFFYYNFGTNNKYLFQKFGKIKSNLIYAEIVQVTTIIIVSHLFAISILILWVKLEKK